MADRARSSRIATAVALLATLLLVVTACSEPTPRPAPGADPTQVDAVEAPRLGACRRLELDDVAAPTNATKVVGCSSKHTAETYAVGDLPAELRDAAYDSAEVGRFAYDTCDAGLRKFLGADDSQSMRTVLSWAWFRPSEKAWDDGARWYRCDVIGGGEQSAALVSLPRTARGILSGRPDDRWVACVKGPSVADSAKIPCTQPHDWRAVTTIKLGEAADPYPGDRLSEVQSRDFCKKSVQAYLDYPPQFQFGFTWFHEAEWKAGNRRSVCWAKTNE
ncbi:septum formation family protein [Nocardioides plantarum]|uniref:Septum formation family protein n=1 Tax=Nocardioides plantarum TaxID=29299 RepID=A0ABV5K651_9ACTN|nr:septum formation family protein [Nocardioides plantarum]